MAQHFDPIALEKCFDRLSKCKHALYRYNNAHNSAELKSAWSDFLIFSGSLIHALDAGAQHTPQARQWYGGLMRETRRDPLLFYMYHARNAEEHAVGSPAHYKAPAVFGAVNPETGEAEHLDDVISETRTDLGNGMTNIMTTFRPSERQTGWDASIGPIDGTLKLAEVSDRNKQVFAPPTEHLGKKLNRLDPLSLGQLYLDYLASVVKRAAEMT